jgi:hypothetical protein
VTFDVGGKIYRVSRSLIEQHDATVLARMISETWQTVGAGEVKGSAIFIDRDGDRFAYVLDFMRYGHVVLPYHISRELFLLDLDFFGVSGASDETVTTGHFHLGHVQGVNKILEDNRRMQSEVANLQSQIADNRLKLAAARYASRCFSLYTERTDAGSTVALEMLGSQEPSLNALRCVEAETRKMLVDACLKEYGLELIQVSESCPLNRSSNRRYNDVDSITLNVLMDKATGKAEAK